MVVLPAVTVKLADPSDLEKGAAGAAATTVAPPKTSRAKIWLTLALVIAVACAVGIGIGLSKKGASDNVSTVAAGGAMVVNTKALGGLNANQSTQPTVINTLPVGTEVPLDLDPPAPSPPPAPPGNGFVPTDDISDPAPPPGNGGGVTDFTLPVGNPPEPVKMVNTKFVGLISNAEVTMKGVSWFGFENGNTMVEGLYGVQDQADPSYISDFADQVYALQLLGFNAIRLPWTKDTIFDTAVPKSLDYGCTLAKDADVVKWATDPAVTPAKAAPGRTFPRLSSSKICNDYIPNRSVLQRYLFVIRYLVASGFYVVVDYHPRGVDQAVYTNTTNFSQAWSSLWSYMMALPNFEDDIRGRVFLELFNEPDHEGISWDAGGLKRDDPTLPSLTSLYLTTMDAIAAIDPTAIFMLNGAGQADNTGLCWGDGFITDDMTRLKYNASNPNPFFRALSYKAYKSQVILTPHLYGPSVTSVVKTAPEYNYLWGMSWGKMNTQGYCFNSSCTQYAIVPTEFGSRLLEDQKPNDLLWFDTLKQAFGKLTPAGGKTSVSISSWFWWCWSPNSADTGGLIDDQYTNIEWYKIRQLTTLGLRPWYM